MIEINGVMVAFGRSLALDEIQMSIPEGICGLFGPNGSGKTTLLRVMSGLLRPTTGTVTFAGGDIDVRSEEFRRMVGYAGHEAGLYDHLTVGENLALFARLHGAPEARVDEVLEDLQIADRKDVRVHDLSAGLKRRAAVGRAIVHQPALLLLDEPYANLDDDAAEAVSAALVSWSRPGRCGVVATHGAKRLKPIVNTSVVLRRGRVASFRSLEDSPAEIAT